MKQHLTMQIHVEGGWHDAAIVEILDVDAGIASPTTLAYDTHYYLAFGNADFHAGRPAMDHRALSVRRPLDLDTSRLQTWPPFLLDLLPQGAARNRLAAEIGLSPESKALDLPLLLRAASAPIGNLRVKEAWTAEQERIAGLHIQGVTEREILERSAPFRELVGRFALIASGSSGVQGEWPKLLLTRAKDGLYYPDSVVTDEQAEAHIIVKMSRAKFSEDRLILWSEASYHHVAHRLGLRVGAPLHYSNDTLIIPRFDREVAEGKVVRLGQESLVSALGVAEFGHVTTHERYIETLHQHCTDPRAEIVEYVLRDVINQAMGDTDNHGRNTALQKRPDGRIGLAPRFDFAPMVFDPGIIAPATSWDCLRGRPLHIGYGPVCDSIAKVTGEPEIAAAVRDALVEKADLVGEIPDVAGQYEVPEEVVSRACRRAGEIAGMLRALAGGR
jgi:serine/threonine-protein kinase HipA